jgi:hypothetical protein
LETHATGSAFDPKARLADDETVLESVFASQGLMTNGRQAFTRTGS